MSSEADFSLESLEIGALPDDRVVSRIPSILTHPYEELPFPEVVDNSILSGFKRCETYGRYAYFENLAPRGTSIHLHAGGAFAEGVEHVRRAFYVDGKSKDEAVAAGVTALLRYYGDYECPPDSAKSAERMAGALVYYFDVFDLEHDYIKPWTDGRNTGIEFSFAFPLRVMHPRTGLPILYAGRFDMLGEHRDGPLFVEDDKTATSLGAAWSNQWELDSQFTGYCYAARLYGKPVAGAVIRGVSILKTKYDHKEAHIYRSQWETDRWLVMTERRVQRMIEIYENWNDIPQLDKSACGAYGGCTYVPLCKTPDPDRWKGITYEPRVWHPMHHMDRKKEIGSPILGLVEGAPV